MTKRYDLIMDRIKVTDGMRDRILNNIGQIDPKTTTAEKHPIKAKTLLSIAACLVVLLLGTFTLQKLMNQPTKPPVQMVPNIVSYSSAQELSDAIGFSISDLSYLPFEIKTSTYLSHWGELAEIRYANGEKTAVYRKSAGDADNSGDFSSYTSITALELTPFTAALKGNAEGYQLAVWSDGEFSYSIKLSFEISEAEWYDLFSEFDEK